MPNQFPTHTHPPQFWEQLGRTVATYGLLEEVLGRAIFAFTSTTHYSEDKINAAYQNWLPKLEKGLSEPLRNLAKAYEAAVLQNSEASIQNINELVDDIKKSSVIRNVLCHGSWPPPNSEGKSVPLYVNYKMEVWDIAIDIEYLKETQVFVTGLICSVIDTVTHMGWQFPGSAGPGQVIWLS